MATMAEELYCSPSASQQLHVLAVDDSYVDRKLIERLLQISSFKGEFLALFIWVGG